ncbi:SIS domain-containing protein [Catelliglobosispora koreensis]|uniref:SIS domain-containing protein n=1 Tax=Catelliglobosispora koreensis TaxID=129052 RepID=UPI000366D3D8|nr:hypothetical protein [Catelliglobosispora koreensis]
MTRISFAEGRDGQPEALERIARTMSVAVPRATRPLFCGIGASFASLAVPVHLLRGHGIAAHRVLASEVVEHPGAFGADLLIGVSQSGRSAETLAAFEVFPGFKTAIVNVSPSPLTEIADSAVSLGDEPDSFASTVGYTGTIVALDLIAAAISGTPDAARKWDDIAALVTATRESFHVPSRAATCVAADLVASGASRASAEETALLLREVPRLPATASATRNYLHGEMESAGNTLHVIFGDGREIELAQTLARAGHLTVLVTAHGVPAESGLEVLRLPETEPAVRAVLEAVVAQELAAALADHRRVPVESFVFANNDTKAGGLDPADFAIQSAGAVA